MKKVRRTFYKCEICGHEFRSKKDCQRCEEALLPNVFNKGDKVWVFLEEGCSWLKSDKYGSVNILPKRWVPGIIADSRILPFNNHEELAAHVIIQPIEFFTDEIRGEEFPSITFTVSKGDRSAAGSYRKIFLLRKKPVKNLNKHGRKTKPRQ